MTKSIELQGLLDSKKEYIDHLCDMLSEPMVACFQRMYKHALEKPDAHRKSVLVVFQEELGSVATWNQTTVTEEFAVARKKSGCKYVADLVKAILVTYVKISIISNTASADTSRVKLRIPLAENFYHKCIVLFAREIWKQPYLFYHKVANIEAQHNLTEVESIARKVVKTAIRSFVPMDQLVRDINLHDSPVVVQQTPDDPESDSDSDASDEQGSSQASEGSESEEEQIVEEESDEVSEYEEVVETQDENAGCEVEKSQEDLSEEGIDEEEAQEAVVDEEVQKEINIDEPIPSLCYDDKDIKDIDIRSHISQESDEDNEEEANVATNSDKGDDAPKKKIILGSMLINKGRHKLIKPLKKKPVSGDAFF